MLKIIITLVAITKPSTLMINKKALYKCRCQLDFLALLVLIFLLSLVANLIFDVVNLMNSDTYTNLIVQAKPSIN